MPVVNSSKDMWKAYHMGRCQSPCATSNDAGQASWACTSSLMKTLTSSIRCKVNSAIALHKRTALATLLHSWIAALCIFLSLSASKHGPVSAPGTYDPFDVLLLSRSEHSSICIHSLNAAMPRERLRLLSRRRGGSGGRAASQRSSETLEPGRSSPPATRSGRGTSRGRIGRVECEHAAHPIVRYRIPCFLANSTFIVSITIEKCEDNRDLGAAHPEALAEQRNVNPVDNLRPVMGSASQLNPAVPARPSAPVRGEPRGSVAPHSDSKDSLQYGCRVVEEPYTPDDD